MSTFDEFGLDPALTTAVEALGFATATPVQAQTMPPLLAGKDLIGQARTGSGKTAAFGLPLLERVKTGGKMTRALVLAPTRELAIQVTEALRSFAGTLPVRVVPIYGGAPYGPQLQALRNGATIVVGTPGRVIDHIERGTLNLGHVECLVLDEADEMLRMGFLEAVEFVLKSLPEERQIALFSATMPAPIKRVSERFLNDPVTIEVEGSALSTDHIEQYWIRVPQRHKLDALMRILHGDPTGATLIFTRTRRGCADVAEALNNAGVDADAIHGDLNQSARERVLNRLRAKKLSVLVATDVAARGLDVSHLSRVVNLDYPNGAETYVHRIGRTGRAGAKGVAITMVTPGEQRKLHFLERAIKVKIQQMRPPSNTEIVQGQKAKLWQALEEARVNDDLTAARDWFNEVRAESGVQPKDIATAAIYLLAQARGVQLGQAREEPRPPPERQQRFEGRSPVHMDRAQRRNRPATDRVNEVQLFLSIGREGGVRPADIVGALANEAGIPSQEIGRIDILDRRSFVGLPKSVAEHVLDIVPTLVVRGKRMHLSIAENRPPDNRRSSKPKRHGDNRAPKSHHGKRKGRK
jgi:ATP-dependent RNA helicase DeaD